MSDVKIDTVRSTNTAIPGRTLNSARANHFVIDSPSGPNEAVTSAEAFLSGVSSCGVTLVEARARQGGVPLESLAVAIEGVRDRADMTRFQGITMRFELAGPTQQQAEELVGLYKEQ